MTQYSAAEMDTRIDTLGPARFLSDICNTSTTLDTYFVSEDQKVYLNVRTDADSAIKKIAFEEAGPRKNLFFEPGNIKCGIVTCGGLCPGINSIIRAITLELIFRYRTPEIYGFRFGLQGFIDSYGYQPVLLTRDNVNYLINFGGSILGSSRGPQPIDQIVNKLVELNLSILFMVGGDGTLAAADAIATEIQRRNLKISIITIPKTIDNDIYLISRSFGFETAMGIAAKAIISAHHEATGYPNGIGLIKLMGRHSGFIAAHATLAQQYVNFTLIPEVPFTLEGSNGLLAAMEKRLNERGHAVIVVAEGAGQYFLNTDSTDTDASGNVRLKDIGIFLKNTFETYFAQKNIPLNLKYIDPSYMIRSVAPSANDNVLCGFLARAAVHAGMAGKTRLMVGQLHDHFVHIPMRLSAGKRKYINPNGALWRSVLEATGQKIS